MSRKPAPYVPTPADEARRLVAALSEELRYGVSLAKTLELAEPAVRETVAAVIRNASQARRTAASLQERDDRFAPVAFPEPEYPARVFSG